jgi:hypothetical protein
VSHTNAQRLWSQKNQNIIENRIYIKAQMDWGNAELITDFDPILAEQLQYALDSTMAYHNIIGTSASIIMPEKGTWNGVYGMSNPITGDSIRSDMLFGIGVSRQNLSEFLSKILRDTFVKYKHSLHIPYLNFDDVLYSLFFV